MNQMPQKNMRKIEIEPGDGGVPHRVYDLSIENINERKEKSKVFPSATDTMNFLGVAHTTFYNNRRPGKRIYSVVHEKYFAVRVDKCPA